MGEGNRYKDKNLDTGADGDGDGDASVGRVRSASHHTMGSGIRMASGHAGSRRHSGDMQSSRHGGFKSSRRFNENNVFRGESVAFEDLSGFVAPIYQKSPEAMALLKEALSDHFLFAQVRYRIVGRCVGPA